MEDYHKINSLYKRHQSGKDRGKFIYGEFSTPEFEEFQHAQWVGTEKIDGTNIKIHWDGEKVLIGGRTVKSQIPPSLMIKLKAYTDAWDFKATFGNIQSVTLYGEGYGKGIQKVGKLYIPDYVDFILYDILVVNKVGDSYFAGRYFVNRIAKKLCILSVPVIFQGTIAEAIEFVKKGFQSQVAQSELQAEGLVLLYGSKKWPDEERIITKLKTRDFENEC